MAFEGKICAAHYARIHDVPYLGICLGLQAAVCEFARNVAGLEGATSTEFDKDTPYPVIDLMPEQEDIEDKGGTMRLGAYACRLTPGTKSEKAYGEPLVYERHRHRYEVNNAYRDRLSEAGMVISGLSPDGRLTEMIELPDHPWFVASHKTPPAFLRFHRRRYRASIHAAVILKKGYTALDDRGAHKRIPSLPAHRAW